MASSSSLEKIIPETSRGRNARLSDCAAGQLCQLPTQRTLSPNSASFCRCQSRRRSEGSTIQYSSRWNSSGRCSRIHPKMSLASSPPCAPPPQSASPRSCPPLLDPRRRHSTLILQPLRKLKRQQLAKQAAHAHAGVVIAAAPDNVLFSFVISIIWTIERQLHEAREGDGAAVSYLSRDYFGDFAQLLGVWCGFSYQSPRLYGILWRKSTHSSI